MKKFFLFLLVCPSLANSQEAISIKDLSFLKNLSGSIEMSAESNLYKPSSSQHALSSGIEMALTYKNSDKMTTNLVGGASKDLTDEKTQSFNDTSLYLNSSLGSWKDYANFIGRLGAILPTNEESRETKTLQGALFISPRVIFDLKSIGLKYVSFGYYLGVTLSFHEYKYSTENQANNQISSSHTFLLNYAPLEKLSFTYALKLVQGWTYAGNLNKPSYVSSLSADSNITQKLSCSLGLSTGGSMYKANGNDSNMKIYDNTETTIAGSLAIAF